MAKRANGEGSIYRRNDGRYCGQYFDGNKQRYVYGADKEKVRLKLAKSIADRDSGLVFDAENLTVQDYLERWLSAIEHSVSHRTWVGHEQKVRLHLIPTIGATKLEKLSALQIQTLYESKLKSGLHQNTVRKIHATLYKAIKQAVKFQLVPRNVCEAVTPPKEVREEVQTLSKSQINTLLDTAKDDPLHALYVLAVSTGMRQAELLALKWDSVNFDTGTVRVRRTVWKGIISEPKTPRSRRTVKLSQLAIRALSEHRQKQAINTEWVFPSQAGTPIDNQNFIHHKWKRLLKRAGLPQSLRFHSLRHACCVLLLSESVSARVVADQLGHSDPSFTLRVYADALSSMGNTAAEAMDNLLG